MKIKRLPLMPVLLAVFLPAFTGCRGDRFDVVLGPADERSGQEAVIAAESAWDELGAEGFWESERVRPVFLPAGRARDVPRLTLRDERGATRRIDPAGDDEIFVVVFWSLDTSITMSAVLHADYLVHRYSDYGVRGVAIVENPDTYDNASEFLDANDVSLDGYYDDFSALRRLSRAAGRDIERELPSFFLIDGRGRVRLSKLGFSPSGVADEWRGTDELAVVENAPQGERIEDYLRRLIEERDSR